MIRLAKHNFASTIISFLMMLMVFFSAAPPGQPLNGLMPSAAGFSIQAVYGAPTAHSSASYQTKGNRPSSTPRSAIRSRNQSLRDFEAAYCAPELPTLHAPLPEPISERLIPSNTVQIHLALIRPYGLRAPPVVS